MVRVSPEMERDKIEAVCAANNVKSEENALCYFIYIDGALGGICLFKLIKGGGRIIALQNVNGAEDDGALIIGGRACLDFIERTSGFDAYYEADSIATAKALGFNEKEGRLYLDMHGYFGNCGGCCHK